MQSSSKLAPCIDLVGTFTRRSELRLTQLCEGLEAQLIEVRGVLQELKHGGQTC